VQFAGRFFHTSRYKGSQAQRIADLRAVTPAGKTATFRLTAGEKQAILVDAGWGWLSMFGLSHLFYPWGIFVQAFAIIHFFRRRPEVIGSTSFSFWDGPGAAIYILAEVLPGLGLLRDTFQGFGRSSRIQKVETVKMLLWFSCH
jgi:hypothetical protein